MAVLAEILRYMTGRCKPQNFSPQTSKQFGGGCGQPECGRRSSAGRRPHPPDPKQAPTLAVIALNVLVVFFSRIVIFFGYFCGFFLLMTGYGFEGRRRLTRVGSCPRRPAPPPSLPPSNSRRCSHPEIRGFRSRSDGCCLTGYHIQIRGSQTLSSSPYT